MAPLLSSMVPISMIKDVQYLLLLVGCENDKILHSKTGDTTPADSILDYFRASVR